MAAARGMNAGTEIVFSYGPLGFLGIPALYEVGLGRLAFAWFGLVQVAFCISLLWGARRAFGLPVGLVVACEVQPVGHGGGHAPSVAAGGRLQEPPGGLPPAGAPSERVGRAAAVGQV